MAAVFPPQPVYPLAYDSDYTLFKVYNTTESRTTADNNAWSDEIPIQPVCDDAAEIWAENGFASIDGELFYYDSVSTNAAGKVCALRSCARNLGGEKTKANPAGTWVRGVVVADVHNQLALTLMIIERTVLELDSDMSMLEDLPPVQDDCCIKPTLSFRDTNPGNPRSNSYSYNATIVGDYSEATIDFGDGNSTKNLSGNYTYCGSSSPAGMAGSDVNPVLTVQGKNCSISLGPRAVRPHARKRPPTVPTTEIYIADTPLPEFPQIDMPLKFPPIQFPLLEMPSVYMPSIVLPPNVPSEVTFVNSPDIPDNIIVVDNLPSVIKVESDIPSVIKLEATVELICGRNYDPDFDDFEKHGGLGFTGENFLDGFNMEDDFVMDSVGLGIPSEIHIIAPRMPNLKVIHDLPTEIRLSAPYIPPEIHIPELREHPIPREITLKGAAEMPREINIVNRDAVPKEIMVVSTANIPHTIMISGETIPDEIPLRVAGMPKEVRVVGMPETVKVAGIPEEIKVTGLHDIHVKGIPEHIRVVTDHIPESINLRLMSELPTYIFVDASAIPKDIRVTGFPESIEVKVVVPELPPMKFEQDHIKLVYDGPPLQMQFPQLQGELGDDVPCFAIIPCKRG